jgi:F-type H+-transporting ATPase subunit delta
MKISRQTRREAKQLFVNCRTDGLLDDSKVRQVVQRVIEARPRGYVAILTHFQRLVKLDIARRSARVESATALSADLQGQARDQLARRYGPGLILQFAQNPALIGGLRIQVGSDVYDGSIQARLRALAESL